MMSLFARVPFRRLLLALLAAVSCLLVADGLRTPVRYADRPDVQAFIRYVARVDALPPDRLRAIFNQVTPLPGLLNGVAHPRAAPPWGQYRRAMLTEARIDGGVAFWRAHRAVLAHAERVYGVPPAIIVSLLGIETVYGRKEGNWRVIDTLATLAFDHPRRSAYFRRELEDFLVMTLRAGTDPLSVRGSAAGAFGMGQFLPSNVLRYGVDFDRDGRTDPSGDTADAIGSIAHFLAHHGWQAGQPVAIQVSNAGPEGGIATVHLPDGRSLTGRRLTLQGDNGPEYWVGFPNFFVLTAYNRSFDYAMAVYQLSLEIQQRRSESD